MSDGSMKLTWPRILPSDKSSICAVATEASMPATLGTVVNGLLVFDWPKVHGASASSWTHHGVDSQARPRAQSPRVKNVAIKSM